MPRNEASLPPAPPKKRVFFLIKVFVVLHIIAITSWSLPNAPSNEDFAKLRQVVAHGDADALESLPANASALAKFKANVAPRLQAAGRIVSDGSLFENDRYVKDSPLKFYLLFTGFWQYWDMFSPNPASIDFYGTATITYKNGDKKLYTFPRMFTLGIPQKYVSERYRKFYERAHTEADNWEWPTFAQRVALVNYKDLSNPPVTVLLTRHWYVVPLPEQQGYEKLVKEWKSSHLGQQMDPITDADFHKQAHDAAMSTPKESDYHHYDYYTHQVDQLQLQKDKAAGIFG